MACAPRMGASNKNPGGCHNVSLSRLTPRCRELSLRGAYCPHAISPVQSICCLAVQQPHTFTDPRNARTLKFAPDLWPNRLFFNTLPVNFYQPPHSTLPPPPLRKRCRRANKSTQLLIYQRFALSNPVLLSKQNLRKMRPFCRFSRHFRHVLAQNRRRPLFTAFTRTASAGAASFPPRSEARTCQWSAQSSTARLPRCAVRVCPQPARQRCRMPPA